MKELLKASGVAAFNKQIVESGGVFTEQYVSELLGVSLDEVAKGVENSSLLSVPFEEGTGFPKWQFNQNDLVEHFAEIMEILNTSSSSVGIFRFFLTYDEDLGKTSIDALRSGTTKELEMVKILAAQFNNQVAR